MFCSPLTNLHTDKSENIGNGGNSGETEPLEQMEDQRRSLVFFIFYEKVKIRESSQFLRLE